MAINRQKLITRIDKMNPENTTEYMAALHRKNNLVFGIEGALR